jgi:hypothetical protein
VRSDAVWLPGLEGSLANQGRAVLAALGSAEIAPEEATAVMQAIAALARIVEVDELEKRVAVLEAKNRKP